MSSNSNENGDKVIKAEDVSPYAHHILWLRTLQAGGYPFKQDDLSMDEWEDLGRANEVIGNIKSSQMIAAGMPGRLGI